ncbi:MAG: hypothetical protein HN396_18325 [Gemmatimonadales bacterium]|jgi:hypothetical protein|nr:hypothetical protein [Gemmatimonadales bacterium]
MDTRTTGLPEYARISIEVAARKLIVKYGFTHDDLDDIRAEIKLYALRQLPRYDDRKATLKTFISMVVTDGSKHVVRDHFTDKRKQARAASSLDAVVAQDNDGDGVTLAELLDVDKIDIQTGIRTRPRHEQDMLRFDVATVVSGLPDELQACCAEIMNGRSVSAIARDNGLPRSTFRDRVIAPIRSAFEAAGLRKWL